MPAVGGARLSAGGPAPEDPAHRPAQPDALGAAAAAGAAERLRHRVRPEEQLRLLGRQPSGARLHAFTQFLPGFLATYHS